MEEGNEFQDKLEVIVNNASQRKHDPVGEPLFIIRLLRGVHRLDALVSRVQKPENLGDHTAGKAKDDHKDTDNKNSKN